MTAGSQAPDAPEPVWSPRGLRIATLHGVPVYIGRTWPIIAVVVVALFGPQLQRSRPELGGGAAYLVAVVFAVLLLLSVLTHEAAHAVVARRFGYRVARVVADLWGGHTAYDAAAATPTSSAAVAVAGPLANGALALLGWLALPHISHDLTGVLVGALVWTNGFVAVFNLLPGLPLDGGFLVDALVWRVTGNRDTAMVVAGWCGRAVTVAVVVWALVVPVLRGGRPSLYELGWAAFLGAFLWAGASGAIRAGRSRRLLSSISIGSVWRPAATVPLGATVEQAVRQRSTGLGSGAVPGGPVTLVVVDAAGEAVGLADEEALRAIPESLWATTPVSSVLRRQPLGWVVDAAPEDSITGVVLRMQQLGVPAVPVRGAEGVVEGVVHAPDLASAV